jgi:hypothetical protein
MIFELEVQDNGRRTVRLGLEPEGEIYPAVFVQAAKRRAREIQLIGRGFVDARRVFVEHDHDVAFSVIEIVQVDAYELLELGVAGLDRECAFIGGSDLIWSTTGVVGGGYQIASGLL